MSKQKFLSELVLSPSPNNPFEIPRLLYLVHSVWSPFYDVFQKKMCLDDALGRATFLYWWLGYGLFNYPLHGAYVSEQNWEVLRTNIGLNIGPLNWDYLAAGAYNFDHWSGSTVVPLPDSPGTEHAIKWIYVAVYGKRKMTKHLTQEQIRYLREIHEDYSGDHALSRLEVFLYELDPELQKNFSLASNIGRQEYRRWFNDVGAKQHQLTCFFDADEVESVGGYEEAGFGVNIIGHVNSVSGVGEDLRMAQASLDAAGVPNQILPYLRSANRPSKLYSINLLCLTGFQGLLSLGSWEDSVFDRYTIGYFPWELEEWPNELRAALDFCDEHWTSTRFIFESIKKKTNKPVYLMPMAVDVPEYMLSNNDTHYAPNVSKVRYLFMFDLISGVERKNAWQCIDAFQRAFENDQTATLTIKLINPQGAPQFFEKINSAVRNDQRIQIISDMLHREALLRLIAEHDVFISLHRSEGFGRGIAESLLLGKQVVTTNYSGNIDFCHPEFCFLVDFEMVPVRANEYVFSNGQFWASPKTSSAVEKLLACHRSVIGGQRFNAAGQKYIRDHYSIETVSKRYRERIQLVGIEG